MNVTPVLFGYPEMKNRYRNKSSFKSFLYQNQKSGKILKVRNGLYSLTDPSTGFSMANKFQIACKINQSAFLGYHAALEYYGLTEQSFASVMNVCSLSRFSCFEFQGIQYECFLETSLNGVIDRIQEEGIRVTSIEKTLVDCIKEVEKAGGIEEVENAFKLSKGIDEKKLLSFLKEYDSDFLYLKAGYAFSHWYSKKMTSAFYKECQKHKKKKIYYFGIKKGDFSKEWNLIVPKEREEKVNEIY